MVSFTNSYAKFISSLPMYLKSQKELFKCCTLGLNQTGQMTFLTGQDNLTKNARYSISAKFQNLSTLFRFNGVDYVFTGNKSDKMDAFSFLT